MRTAPLLLSLMIAGCAGTAPEAAAPEIDAATLIGSSWRLRAFEGHRLPEDPDAAPITLAFDKDRVSGRGPCNSLSASYAVESGRLTLGPIATSKRLCAGVSGELEPAYLEALRSGLIVRFDQRALVLTADTVVLRYEASTAIPQ